MKQKQKFLSILLCFTMVFSIFTMSYGTVRVSAKESDLNAKRIAAMKDQIKAQEKVDFNRAVAQKFGQATENNQNDNINPNNKVVNSKDEVRVIVELTAPSTFEIAKQRGIKFEDAYNLAETVKAGQIQAIDKVRSMGAIRHTYQNLINGFSAVVKYKDIDSIREISGVKKVTVANVYYPDMNSAVGMTKASNVWTELGYKGEGTVVSVVDTGNDYNHKDMRLTDPSKAKLNKAKVTAMGGPGHFFTDKVPYGYNFADMSDDVIPRGSEHGMHVSGIVGANGTDAEIATNAAIKGVAPEAQILAMKVFSNNPEIGAGAYNDDVAAAIEDSVKHGADIINMSLGSTASFVNYDDPEQMAIQKATDAGTIVVVSGGNSYYSVYPQTVNYTWDPDTEVVGGPGLFPDTIQVASYENDKMLLPSLNYGTEGSNGIVPYTTSDIDPVGVLNGQYELVDCGYGAVSDFTGKNVTGKIALMSRGAGLAFVDKKLNAQAAGAIGAIVYNNTNDSSYINMATDPRIKIPGIFVTTADGKKLKELIASGVKVSFKGTLGQINNASAGNMSAFSSWGPTPDFRFKPEVTAPGGNIWSTIPNNKYENMSGTSMASPHTAGGMALVVQYLKSLNISAEKRDFVALAKKLIINSADPIIDPATTTAKLPYLTRKQGAGLIKIDKAIKTKAYVTDSKDNATIAIKSVGNTTNIKLKVTNFGDKELTFTPVNNYGVLTSRISGAFMYQRAMNIPGANVSFGSEKVTVPAKGIAELNMTLNIPTGTPRNIFAEGFVTLKSSDEAVNPSIGIPFMTFYGNWDEPRVFDSPIWDGNNYYGRTTLIDGDNYLGYEGQDAYGPVINPTKIAISPDGDGYKDVVMPYIDLMRNAKEMKVQVLDKDGKVIRDVALENNIRKTYYNSSSAAPTAPKYDSAWAWDGTVYNPKTGAYELAKDDQYTIRLLGRVDGGTTYTSLDMPVKLDTTAPDLEISGERIDGKHYRVRINGNDNFGIEEYGVFLNDYANAVEYLDGDAKEYTFEIPNDLNQIAVVAFDHAGNVAVKELVVNNLAFIPLLKEGFENTPEGLFAGNTVKMGYSILENLKSSVDHYAVALDKETAINNGLNEEYEFNALAEGVHNIIVDAMGKDGKLIAEIKLPFVVDTKNPIITVSDPKEAVTVLTNGEKEYRINMKVNDTSGYKLYVNDQIIDNVDGPNAENQYSYPVNIPQDGCKIVIKAIDRLGYTDTKEYSFVTDIQAPIITIDTPAKNELVFGKTVAVVGKVVNKKGVSTYLEINGTEAKVAEDGTFAGKVVFGEYGANTVVVKAGKGEEQGTSVEVAVKNIALQFNNAAKKYYSNGLRDKEGNDPKVTIGYKLPSDDLIDHVNVVLGNENVINNALKSEIVIPTIDFPLGNHNIKFEVCDKDGKVLFTDIAVIVIERDLPTVTIPSLASVPMISSNEFAFTGSASEPLQSIVFKTGEPAANVPQEVVLDSNHINFEGVLKNLHEGLNRIEVTMKDIAGNEHKYEYKIYVDLNAPVLKVTDPLEDTVVVVGNTYTVKMSVQDNVTGYRLYINNNQIGYAQSEAYDGQGTYKEFECVLDIPGGNSTFVIKAVDFVGNSVEKVLNFKRNFASEFSVTPGAVVFDVNAKADILVGVTPNTTELKGIKNGEYTLVKGTDYVVNSNSVVLAKSYLSTLPLGTTDLAFSFGTALDGKLTNEVILKVNVVDQRSKDAYLKAIKINNIDLEGFDPGTMIYNYEVSSAIDWIPQVSAEANSEKATVDMTQAAAVPGKATISVTAEDGTKQVYTINFVNDIIVTKVSPQTSYTVGSQAKLTINVKNQSSRARQATLIMGLYTTNNEMIYYVAASQIIEPGKDVDLNGVMSIPAALVGNKQCEIRYFVWDSIEGMTPLSKMGTIPVVQNNEVPR